MSQLSCACKNVRASSPVTPSRPKWDRSAITSPLAAAVSSASGSPKWRTTLSWRIAPRACRKSVQSEVIGRRSGGAGYHIDGPAVAGLPSANVKFIKALILLVMLAALGAAGWITISSPMRRFA